MAKPAGENLLSFRPASKSAMVPEMVTPAMAKRWLKQNTLNRNLRASIVDAYARDMVAGNWQLTGEAIKFAANGRLLDGQHRLHAIVKSGVTIETYVVRGVAESAQSVMDTATIRTASDALKLTGHKHSTILATTVRVALLLARGEGNVTRGPSTARVTHSEIGEFIDEHPDVLSAVDFVAPFTHHISCARGACGYVAWRLRAIDEDAAGEFIASVATQEMLRSTDPRMVLAKRLTTIREQRIQEPTAAVVAIFFHAWNHWRQGRAVTHLKAPRPIRIPDPR